MSAKVILAVVVFVGIVALIVFARSTRAKQASPALELRQMALTSEAGQFGIQPTDGEAWGVVMDTTYPNGSASLLSLSDGSASLYFSTGGGVIGGQSHVNVASAAKAFVREATKHQSQLAPATDLALPVAGKTRFYVRTVSGIVAAEASESELGAGKHPLSPLFFAGQEVITQLRAVTEAQR